jgi:hypothetical protein
VKRPTIGMKPPTHPAPALTRHPYRHAAIAHGVLALVIAGLGWATAAHVGRTVLLALGYFVLATGWTWWRYRVRGVGAEAGAE